MTFSRVIIDFVWVLNLIICGIVLFTIFSNSRRVYKMSQVDETVIEAEYFYASLSYLLFTLAVAITMMFINVPAFIKHQLYYFTYRKSSDTSISLLTFIDRYAMFFLAILGDIRTQKVIAHSFISFLKKVLPLKLV